MFNLKTHKDYLVRHKMPIVIGSAVALGLLVIACVVFAAVLSEPSAEAGNLAGFGGEGCGGDDSAKFNREALAKHNEYRKVHQSKPLATSSNLAGYAQETANRLASGAQPWGHDLARLHQLGIGENLFAVWGSGFTINGATAVESWYEELNKPGYDFDSPGFSIATGHFTQVVWASSTEVGCGAAKSKEGGKCYVVCNYSPPGNYKGQFPENVKRPFYPLSTL